MDPIPLLLSSKAIREAIKAFPTETATNASYSDPPTPQIDVLGNAYLNDVVVNFLWENTNGIDPILLLLPSKAIREDINAFPTETATNASYSDPPTPEIDVLRRAYLNDIVVNFIWENTNAIDPILLLLPSKAIREDINAFPTEIATNASYSDPTTPQIDVLRRAYLNDIVVNFQSENTNTTDPIPLLLSCKAIGEAINAFPTETATNASYSDPPTLQIHLLGFDSRKKTSGQLQRRNVAERKELFIKPKPKIPSNI